MKDISKVSFGRNGKFAILDSSGPSVYMFANNGSYIGQLGSKGRGPGRYKIPWSITSTEAGFAVVDFLDHRVNIYDYDRRLTSSFIYSVQRFSSIGIQRDQLRHKFYLFGNRVRLSGQSQAIDFVHVYSDSGDFQRSIYQLPSAWLKANYIPVDTPLLATDEKQDQYFMFPFEGALYRINQLDLSVTRLPLNLPHFAPPSGPLPENQKGMAAVLSWNLKFTPIRALTVYRGNTIVEYESHRGLRYTLAFFHAGSTEPIRTLETNQLLLGINSDGMAVFTNNPSSARQDIRELTYGRFLL